MRRLGEREVRGADAGARCSSPNMMRTNASSAPRRWAMVRPLSMARHSIWWKTGRVRRVEVVGAEDLARRHDVDRRLLLEHGADLHRRGLRAQHETGVDRVEEEGVLHLARRVVGAEVERVEVEPLALELRPSATSQPMPTKASTRRWRRARWGGGRRAAARAGHGDVDALLDEDALVALGLELGLAGRERRPTGRGPGRRACRPRPWRSAAARRSRGWRGRAGSSPPGARCARP